MPPPQPRRSIQIYEPSSAAPETRLSTKRRLANTAIASSIRRATPVPAPPSSAQLITKPVSVSDPMEVDPSPTMVAHENAHNNPFQWEQDINSDSEDDTQSVDHDVAANPPFSEVDHFLNAPELRDAILSRVGRVSQPPPKRPVPDHRPSRPVHQPAPIPQWAWKGRVTISVSGRTETLCQKATLTDATETQPPRMASFVLSTKDLELTKCYDIDDIFMFLPVCTTPRQFARLIAEGPDAQALEVFSKYMSKKTQAIMIPARWDEKSIGVLIFFSPLAKSILHHLNTPRGFWFNHGLIAVLLLFACDLPPVRILPRLQRRIEPAVLSSKKWHHSFPEDKKYQVGLRILQLPKSVRKFVFTHASTVWFKCTTDDVREDQDTQFLLHVLNKSRVGVVSPTDMSADMVFVHVGALRNIHNLPHLTLRRLYPEIRFCLYGTHRAVSPSRWGFREIYLLGGIVTFTPTALVTDAWSVLKTIRRIHAHPLWACYLIPQAVGMAVKLNQLQEDETPDSYTGILPYPLAKIFCAVLKGEVSLLHTPLNNPSGDEFKQWVLDHSLFRPLTTQAILERCTTAFEEAYTSFPQANWASVGRSDVLADMRRMQTQPAVLTEYRRFVVLDSSGDSSQYTSTEGVEWDSVGNFDFRDDFRTEDLSIV
ncbi:hypothetical protein B0H19DRAFT_1121271 [Mycena capillaripes]|nr:hypothetical protein B0H19DRAFT_1121271 [Mycena capillaripes]